MIPRVRVGRRCAPASHLLAISLATAALWAVSAPRAQAYDWTVSSALAQRIEVSDNPGVSLDNTGGGLFVSSSTATAYANANAKTTQINFLANTGYTAFRGIESSDFDRESISRQLAASVGRQTKLSNYGLSAAYSTVSTFFSEDEDTGLIGSSTNRVTYTTSGSASHQLSAIESISFGASYNKVTFDRATVGLNEFESYNFTSTYRRRLNPTMSGGFSGLIGVHQPQGEGTTGSVRYAITADLSRQIRSYLSVNSNVGIRLADSGASGLSDIGSISDDTAVSYPFNFAVRYQGKTSSAGLNLSSVVGESAGGGLLSTTAARFNATHQINELTNFGFFAYYSLRVTGAANATLSNSDRTDFGFSPSLTYALTPEWGLNLSYQFRGRDSGDGAAYSNQVFLNLTHNFVPLP